MIKVLIDPGHGGTDPGAVGYGLQEKDITLSISLMLRDILQKEYNKCDIKLSRTTDVSLSLKERTDMANKWGANYLISIHVNAGGGTGFESFTYNGKYSQKQRTSELGKMIHEQIIQETLWSDRGRKEANFHMLRASNMSALLTENGFIDHEKDANLLKNNAFLWKIAKGHVKGLAHAFSLSTKEQIKAQFHRIKQGDTLWSLAFKYGTTVEKLKELNQGIIPTNLQIGQEIYISK